MKKLFIIGLIFSVILLTGCGETLDLTTPLSNADGITYTPTSRTICKDGKCNLALYSGVMFAQNKSSDWVNPSKLLNITRNSDDITFHYNGLEGEYSITFEVGVIYNGNYYSGVEVKTMQPDILIDIPIIIYSAEYKFAINISNVKLDKSKIENVTLTYKSHSGFNLADLKTQRGNYLINDFVKLGFDDLKAYGYTSKIDISERRIYIGNFTDKFNGNELYLDPALKLQTADTENMNDNDVVSTSPDAVSGGGSGAIMYIQSSGGTDIKGYWMFNITQMPSGQVIDDAQLVLYCSDTAGPDVAVHHVNSQPLGSIWTEETITWNNQPCGNGAGVGGNCNTSYEAFVPVEDIGLNSWVNFTVRNAFELEYNGGNETISFIAQYILGDVGAIGFKTKEDATTGQRPVLNITYSTAPVTTIAENIFPKNQTQDYARYVNFTYNTTAIGGVIDNCSLLIKHSYAGDWERNSTDLTITHEINQSFNITLDYEDIYWKVGCYDDDATQANSSAFNYTRIRDYPRVYNVFPKNATQDYASYVNFTYNVTIDTGGISECNLWLKHSYAGDWELNSTDTSITQSINQSFNITLDYEDIYWKTECESDLGIKGNSSAFNYTRISIAPIVKNIFPKNATQDYARYVNFTYNTTIASGSISQCNLWLKHSYAGDWELNSTDLTITQFINQSFNITLDYEDIYWKTECESDLGVKENSSAFNYTRLRAYPAVQLIAPEDDTLQTSRYINFTYNVTVSVGSISECNLWINNTELNSTDTSITQLINQTINITLSNTHNWTWKVECESDTGGKTNSSIWEFILNNAPTIPNILSPVNNTVIYDDTVNLICNGSTDAEDDVISQEFWGSTDPTSLVLLQNSSDTVYTWTPISENNYYWYCRSHDNRSNSAFTAMRRIISLGEGTFNVSLNGTCFDGLTPSMCWDYKDEENLTSLTADIDYNFEVLLTNASVLKIYGAYSNVSETCFCVNSSLYANYTLNYGEIQYEQTGYVDRRYYAFANTRLTNLQVNDTLFLLLNGKSTSFLFEFVSTALSPYENHYSTLNRWYPDLDTYDAVDMGKTDNKGETIMHVVTEDVDYRVGLYDVNGSLIKLLDPIRFACLDSPCTYSSLIQEDPLDYIDFLNVETNGLAFAGGIFTLVYNDPSQNTQEMTLKVYKETGTTTLELCTDTSTGYTGVLTCDVSTYTGQLRAIAYRTASPEIPIAQRIVNTVSTIFKGDVGLFVTLFIFLVLVFIGALYGPVPTLIFGIIALIPAVVLGTLTTSIVVGLGTLVGIVVHFMKRVGP